jgi:hypothetical protein
MSEGQRQHQFGLQKLFLQTALVALLMGAAYAPNAPAIAGFALTVFALLALHRLISRVTAISENPRLD